MFPPMCLTRELVLHWAGLSGNKMSSGRLIWEQLNTSSVIQGHYTTRERDEVYCRNEIALIVDEVVRIRRMQRRLPEARKLQVEVQAPSIKYKESRRL